MRSAGVKCGRSAGLDPHNFSRTLKGSAEVRAPALSTRTSPRFRRGNMRKDFPSGSEWQTAADNLQASEQQRRAV